MIRETIKTLASGITVWKLAHSDDYPAVTLWLKYVETYTGLDRAAIIALIESTALVEGYSIKWVTEEVLDKILAAVKPRKPLDIGFDHEAILRENKVEIAWDEGTEEMCGSWFLSWEHGVIAIGCPLKPVVREAAALFVALWLRGVGGRLAAALMRGYISHLEAR
jgi:hypothetical protein